ncbi:MAG: copper chaperone PCu(A)C [Candidatus Puniceispirillum sp.]|jgi:periplasmic copper chaperone A|uniref:copper chaperone PCu(A)C n=1 Tax=uncultured Candidatus Puniceispirillum sp. TaxID=1985115 RepID=UPI002A73B536|nr:copper chaperone PCu(A)C [Candidatus Puniceispirillum sp.]MBT6566867.1 copper chaperone PCu(A)C [Candidatus Puniceispirillum sp.]
MPVLSVFFLWRPFYRILVLFSISIFGIQAANADMQTGNLKISEIEIRATAIGMSATAGYLTIANHGMSADRLMGVKADFAQKSMIHEMTNIDGVAKMRHVMGGVEVPAHGSVALKPGGLHLMFTGVKGTLEAGKMLSVTLVFEKAGAQKLHAIVKKPADISAMSGDAKTKKKHAH